ncbi:MAG: hypothetical protein ACO3A4_09750 [Silvanigrellaceae bacterium]
MLVTKSNILGPFETQDVIEILRKDPEIFHSIQWICPEGGNPLLVLEWFSDFAPEGALEAIILEDAQAGSLFSENISRNEKRAELPPDHGGLNPVQAVQKNHSRFREWFALLCLALVGLALLWIGAKVLRPARALQKPEKPLAAKLLGSTPDALRNYQNLLEGKILRDPKKYARALLSMQKDRSLYPEGFLPSPEMTAAIALIGLTHEELDKLDEWKQLLLRLPPESRQRGLAVVAYELSRVVAVRNNLLSVSEQESKKSPSVKLIQQSMEELGIVFERMQRVIPQSESDEPVLQGILLSRLMSLGLLTILEHPLLAAEQPLIKASVANISVLFEKISTADKTLIGELSELAKLRIANPKAKIEWSKSVERIVEFNRLNRFLCQLNETGSGAASMLFLVTQVAKEKQPMPEVGNLFDSCFVGLRVYPRNGGSPLSDVESGGFDYVDPGAVDEGVLRRFRVKFPTFNPALTRLKGTRNSAGDWMLVFYLNGVLPGRLSAAQKNAKNSLCSKSVEKESVCDQVRWMESLPRWRDRVQLVLDLREDIRPDDVAQLGYNFVFNAAKESVGSHGRKRIKDFYEAVNALKDFVDKEDPRLQFLFDYMQSLGGES